jgi:flavin reductase (DIM6/NTAB) family NADH-FMN oxidoreductase RutF
MLIVSGADIAAMEDRYRALFVNALSGFKAANLVGTRSHSGHENLAIFTSVTHVGANPPLLGLISRPNSVTRNTLANIAETDVYTINHVSTDLIAPAHQTSARYDSEVSEFEAVGLTPRYSSRLTAHYVAESRLCIGLEHRQTIDIPLNGTHLVIGEIVEVELEASAHRR